METGHAFSESILPECNVKVQSLPEGTNDPLFNPLDSGDVKMDPKLGLAAVQGRIGPSLDVLVDAHRTAFNTLNRILNENGKAELQILNQPPALGTSESGVTMSGALNLASTLSEDFLLEYGDGWSGEKLGWGRLNAANLQEILSLHTAYAELMRRTPYLARARGSILANRILRSLEQVANSKETKSAFGAPNTSVVVITGHDTNLSNLSGILQLSWMLRGYPADDTPPGSALIFSVWQSGNSNNLSVRVQFIAQSPDQMHDAIPLSLSNPPILADVFVPGCSTAQKGFPCSWSAFQKTMNAAIDPAF